MANSIDVNISILFEYWQNRKCLLSIPEQRSWTDYVVYEFTSCEGGTGRIPGMSIKVSDDQSQELLDFIDPTDLPCPRK